MKYIEVPIDVLEKVCVKWRRIYRKGKWIDENWHSCAMCKYVWERNKNTIKNTIKICNGCPLRKEEWCKAVGPISRLHIFYHSNDKNNDKNWLKDVGKFVSMMEKMILIRKGAKGK